MLLETQECNLRPSGNSKEQVATHNGKPGMARSEITQEKSSPTKKWLAFWFRALFLGLWLGLCFRVGVRVMFL